MTDERVTEDKVDMGFFVMTRSMVHEKRPDWLVPHGKYLAGKAGNTRRHNGLKVFIEAGVATALYAHVGLYAFLAYWPAKHLLNYFTWYKTEWRGEAS